MQCVFFAHLLLEPRKTLDEDGSKTDEFLVPQRAWVLGIGATEALCLVALPTLLRWMSDASNDAAVIWNSMFGFFQLVLILAPFAVAVSVEVSIFNGTFANVFPTDHLLDRRNSSVSQNGQKDAITGLVYPFLALGGTYQTVLDIEQWSRQ